jgi:hypothetical protein
MNTREKALDKMTTREKALLSSEEAARLASEHRERKLAAEDEERERNRSELEKILSPEDLAKLARDARPEHAQLIAHLVREEHPDVTAERDRIRSHAEAERLIDRALAAYSAYFAFEPEFWRAWDALWAVAVDGDFDAALLAHDAALATSERLCDEAIVAMRQVRQLPREEIESHEGLQELSAKLEQVQARRRQHEEE